jgi:hypothetical protein
MFQLLFILQIFQVFFQILAGPEMSFFYIYQLFFQVFLFKASEPYFLSQTTEA